MVLTIIADLNGCEFISWLFGYYLMAQNAYLAGSKFARTINYRNLFDVFPHHKWVLESEWSSLPELTNDNGSFCQDSCASQLWSIATLLEAINTLKRFS